MIPALSKVETTDEWLLILHYANGEVRSLDFKKEDLSGSLKALQDINVFKQVYISEYGLVEFPNDIQLDPIGLYKDSRTRGKNDITKL
jgi:hypothetical protein